MVLSGLLLVSSSSPALGGPPTEQLRSSIDRVVRILEDPALKGNGRLRERRTIVRQIANEIRIERYEGAKTIQYLGERLAGDVATVSTKILLQNGQEISVDYRMLQREDRWFVFDVLIEGVSLVSNYRGQFNKIIQTSSFGELLRQLRARQKESAM